MKSSALVVIAMTMNVNLSPQLEAMVKAKVASGRYTSASEVVREALRLLEHQDQLRDLQLQELRLHQALLLVRRQAETPHGLLIPQHHPQRGQRTNGVLRCRGVGQFAHSPGGELQLELIGHRSGHSHATPGQSQHQSILAGLPALQHLREGVSRFGAIAPQRWLQRRLNGPVAGGGWAQQGGRGSSVQRGVARLTRPDPQRSFNRRHDDLAVTDLAGVGSRLDRFHHAVSGTIGHHSGEHHLGQQPGVQLHAAIHLGVAHLATESLHRGHSHAIDADGHQGVLDRIQLLGANDGLNLFHANQ